MSLALDNAQRELGPLEVGRHALKIAGRGHASHGEKNGIADYARRMGLKQPTVSQWASAYEVAESIGRAIDLIGFTYHLAAIHAAPSKNWPGLVERMLAEGWTVKQAQAEARLLRERSERETVQRITTITLDDWKRLKRRRRRWDLCWTGANASTAAR